MSIQQINQIVGVGSVDGILTSAALLRLIRSTEVDIVFTQAFTVDKVDISAWKPNRKVAFVDLAVNNGDKTMTVAFVQRLQFAGHRVIAVCDEHSREDWLAILSETIVPSWRSADDEYYDIDRSHQGFNLLIEPQSQSAGLFKSSGAVLVAALGDQLDTHGKMLCETADKADRMEFVGVGALVNQAVKSKIADDSRRVYLARHFANASEADATIQGWIKEYEAILDNHKAILVAKQNLSDGIVRVNAVGKVVDMTTLMSTLYSSGARVVICGAEMFDKAKGCKTRQIVFGTNEKIDLLACVKQVVPTASGFAQKVNVAPESEEVAISAVRTLLRM